MTECGRTVGKRGPRLSGAVACALAIAFAAAAASPTRAETGETDARTLAAHVLSLRSAAVSGEAAALSILADIPGAVSAEASELLWPPFFANAMVKLGRLNSKRPAALYYNPLLDVALFTLWEKTDSGYRVGSARVFPGERLTVAGGKTQLQPAWMNSGDGPLAALPKLAAARLDAFARTHPVQATDAAVDDVSFALAAGDFRAALPRLVWHSARHARWAEAGRWLRPALEKVEKALAAGNVEAILAAAPETDRETAGAMAAMAGAFADKLVLDMVLDAGSGHRLLIGSRPEDGDTYVFVECRIDNSTGACNLRRFMPTSLSG